ncbi:hypothetical protein G6F57_000101 [Rhizopus arrhizus]|uniref:Protein kinase domain-containing protein n=1 Tax=Rhizopus oryzae TaxID=64495 RepID=A0A9P7BYH0_RHIOR|nr:hypothetical protein G6F23_000004 [Rhizopus arrhizus]KAG1249756.1 hypothetical protein G6F68_013158 [Rhizopus microsporus]KAG1424774.1 hypothetical protein G6F58_002226 [Rhizopus delemar]KAG0770505.1 hypothetical protein G6F24_000158 [Rhizopus arrhizus]KAG0797987.1 hypothetical protein G6F21_000078 [Rhizopus arrhizus]
MLTFKEYTKTIDVWSVGCILAETLNVGTPTIDDFYGIKSRRAKDYIRSLPFKKRSPFARLFPNANPMAVDLLEKVLTFNPVKRITVEEA